MKIFKTRIIYIFTIALILTSGFFGLDSSIVSNITNKASASTTDGTIDSIDKYAWSENIGWIDFGTTEGSVQISDSGLSGYAWSENTGWISLDCSDNSSCATVNHGVANDGAGNLSGYAWSENTGWINFNPTGGGVSINSAGEFSGYAWGENIGWIVFNCDTTSSCATVDYKVQTDWRPQASRPQCNNALDDDGDGLTDYPNDLGCSSLTDDDEINPGGGLPPGAGNPPASPNPTVENPQVNFSVVINNDLKYTNNKKVNLKFNTGIDTTKMAISNVADFVGASQIPYQEELEWEFLECNTPPTLFQEGKVCTVYVRFYTQYGVSSETVSDSITLFTIPPEIELTQAKDSYFADEEVIISGKTKSNSTIISYLDGKLLITESQADNNGNWTINFGNLQNGTHKIRVVSKDFAENFSNPLEISFVVKEKEIVLIEKEEAEIETDDKETTDNSEDTKVEVVDDEVIDDKIDETEKPDDENLDDETADPLQSIKEIVSLSSFNNFKNWTEKFGSIKKSLNQSDNLDLIKSGNLAKITFDLPSFSKITEENQSIGIPAEVVFARTANNKIDLNSTLTFKDEGELEQKINIIAGEILNLTVKPEYPVDSIKGYFVFKSGYNRENSDNLSLGSFLKKVVLQANAQEDIEQFLVLSEFEYFDTDQDGIYTANVQSPTTKGEYEIVTMIKYQDPFLGTKMIKLTTIIDPEGYVFRKIGKEEVRIENTTVSIYQFNIQTNQFELWNAEAFDQKNPQITDNTGEYSFLVPEGNYYLTAIADGYLSYQGDVFSVREGEGVHFNIELQKQEKLFEKYGFSLIVVITILFIAIVEGRRIRVKRK